MSAAMDAYNRLLAARRIVTPEEREETTKAERHANLNARIRRKLVRVY